MSHLRGMAYQGRKGVPCPKGNHETEPGEEEYTAIDVNRVEERNGSSLEVDWVDLRRRVKM